MQQVGEGVGGVLEVLGPLFGKALLIASQILRWIMDHMNFFVYAGLAYLTIMAIHNSKMYLLRHHMWRRVQDHVRNEFTSKEKTSSFMSPINTFRKAFAPMYGDIIHENIVCKNCGYVFIMRNVKQREDIIKRFIITEIITMSNSLRINTSRSEIPMLNDLLPPDLTYSYLMVLTISELTLIRDIVRDDDSHRVIGMLSSIILRSNDNGNTTMYNPLVYIREFLIEHKLSKSLAKADKYTSSIKHSVEYVGYFRGITSTLTNTLNNIVSIAESDYCSQIMHKVGQTCTKYYEVVMSLCKYIYSAYNDDVYAKTFKCLPLVAFQRKWNILSNTLMTSDMKSDHRKKCEELILNFDKKLTHLYIYQSLVCLPYRMWDKLAGWMSSTKSIYKYMDDIQQACRNEGAHMKEKIGEMVRLKRHLQDFSEDWYNVFPQDVYDNLIDHQDSVLSGMLESVGSTTRGTRAKFLGKHTFNVNRKENMLMFLRHSGDDISLQAFASLLTSLRTEIVPHAQVSKVSRQKLNDLVSDMSDFIGRMGRDRIQSDSYPRALRTYSVTNVESEGGATTLTVKDPRVDDSPSISSEESVSRIELDSNGVWKGAMLKLAKDGPVKEGDEVSFSLHRETDSGDTGVDDPTDHDRKDPEERLAHHLHIIINKGLERNKLFDAMRTLSMDIQNHMGYRLHMFNRYLAPHMSNLYTLISQTYNTTNTVLNSIKRTGQTSPQVRQLWRCVQDYSQKHTSLRQYYCDLLGNLDSDKDINDEPPSMDWMSTSQSEILRYSVSERWGEYLVHFMTDTEKVGHKSEGILRYHSLADTELDFPYIASTRQDTIQKALDASYSELRSALTEHTWGWNTSPSLYFSGLERCPLWTTTSTLHIGDKPNAPLTDSGSDQHIIHAYPVFQLPVYECEYKQVIVHVRSDAGSDTKSLLLSRFLEQIRQHDLNAVILSGDKADIYEHSSEEESSSTVRQHFPFVCFVNNCRTGLVQKYARMAVVAMRDLPMSPEQKRECRDHPFISKAWKMNDIGVLRGGSPPTVIMHDRHNLSEEDVDRRMDVEIMCAVLDDTMYVQKKSLFLCANICNYLLQMCGMSEKGACTQKVMAALKDLDEDFDPEKYAEYMQNLMKLVTCAPFNRSKLTGHLQVNVFSSEPKMSDDSLWFTSSAETSRHKYEVARCYKFHHCALCGCSSFKTSARLQMIYNHNRFSQNIPITGVQKLKYWSQRFSRWMVEHIFKTGEILMCYHCVNCGYEMQFRIGVVPFFKQRADLYNLSQTNLVLHNDELVQDLIHNMGQIRPDKKFLIKLTAAQVSRGGMKAPMHRIRIKPGAKWQGKVDHLHVPAAAILSGLKVTAGGPRKNKVKDALRFPVRGAQHIVNGVGNRMDTYRNTINKSGVYIQIIAGRLYIYKRRDMTGQLGSVDLEDRYTNYTRVDNKFTLVHITDTAQNISIKVPKSGATSFEAFLTEGTDPPEGRKQLARPKQTSGDTETGLREPSEQMIRSCCATPRDEKSCEHDIKQANNHTEQYYKHKPGKALRKKRMLVELRMEKMGSTRDKRELLKRLLKKTNVKTLLTSLHVTHDKTIEDLLQRAQTDKNVDDLNAYLRQKYKGRDLINFQDKFVTKKFTSDQEVPKISVHEDVLYPDTLSRLTVVYSASDDICRELVGSQLVWCDQMEDVRKQVRKQDPSIEEQIKSDVRKIGNVKLTFRQRTHE